MPEPAGPTVKRGPGHPLALGREVRARLANAIRALLDDPGIQEEADAVRLAVIVLASRTPSSSGVVEIRTSELGRWLGLSASYAASDVVSGLRRSGVVSVDTAEGEYGQDVGLECRVLPMWAAHGVVGHPLALEKKELATLLRLLEAVMAPGWSHRDGKVTPAGLLGSRAGRGAATDRLALLLVVLEAREDGRVRQCGGTVDTKRGRAATTVARLLGCKASAGERVLERLEDRGLVQRVRVETVSGLAHRTRLLVPAVAAAHGKRGTADARGDRSTAPGPDFSEPDVAARGSEAREPDAESQVSGFPVADCAGSPEPDVTAALHTDHPPGVTPACSPAVSGGFSGEGRGGFGDRPECARKREDQAIDGKASDRLPLNSGAGGPLRGEQREKSPSIREKSGRGPVVGVLVRVDGAGQGRLQRGRVALPPEDLWTVLAPVDLVWVRLERSGARQLVVAAARSELKAVEGFAGRTDAPQVLADRLARRLSEQLRTGGPITDPVGWLLARGLLQRQECGDVRCDDRILLDTGRDCPRCEDRQEERRAQRHAVAADVDAAMPHASDAERQVVTAQRLHQEVTVRAWARQTDWEQARARQTAAKARAEDETEQAAAVPAAPVAPVVVPAPRPVAAPDPVVEDVNQEQELVLEDLTREQVLDWRTRAAHDPQIVFDHIDRYGRTSARRLFTGRLVDQVQRLLGLGHLDLGYIPWGQA
ncbi:hypothetical protein ABZ864_44900 [Streptomyces sp. NPDC047082]|uniref:hypothetical protein n=1 Tax=Streptomyces sp. NPDC047082 TaxID=3155259 RepID=UPI0033EAB368